MKKKVLLTILIAVCTFFIGLNKANCENYSNDNNNGNQGMVVGGSCKGNPSTGWCGNELQGFQVRIYKEDPEGKKPDEFVSGPYYFYFKDGDTHTANRPAYFCQLKSGYKDNGVNINYNYEDIGDAKNQYICTEFDIKEKDEYGQLKYIKYIDLNGSAKDEAIWGKFFANAATFNTYLTNNKYALFKQVLDKTGWVRKTDTTYKEYAIIEPLVTVRFRDKYYTGTINALLATNQGFRASGTGGFNFINIYSLIAQNFKINNSGTCVGNEKRHPDGYNGEIKNVDYGFKTYSGCGYNKFYIDEAFINDTCDSKADNKSPSNRISMYEKEYPTDNELLDFTKSGAAACGSNPNADITAGCLSAGLANGTTFGPSDLSQYNLKVSMPNKSNNAYCLVIFSMSNSLGNSNFGTSKAGMAYIGGADNPTTMAVGTVSIECYAYNYTKDDEKIDILQSLTYDSIVSDVKFNGQPLTIGSTTSTKTVGSTGTYANETYAKWTKSFTRVYITGAVNVEIGSGRIVDYETDKVLYGYYSKLGEKKGKHNVNFSINLNSGKIVNTPVLSNSNNSCNYTISDELVDYKFRTIDSNKPFIGKNNNYRKTGANWCYELNGKFDCSYNNQLVQSKIINANDSYNKLNQKPKYKFVLTPSAINTIRDYNSANDVYDLDKYELICDSNTNKCKSNFFKVIREYIYEGKDELVP